MKLETLCRLSGIDAPTDKAAGAREICAITCRSHACVPGCMYVCISGMRADGHAFIRDALAKGAAAVVTERKHPMAERFVQHPGSAVFLSCDDPRATAAAAFNAYYGDPASKLRMVGITGTNGKTSCATMLVAILERAGERCGQIGTTGCRICGKELPLRGGDPCANMTTPDPEELYHALAVMVSEGVRTVVMEVSSHALALRKVMPLHFEVAVFTNFTQDHLDFHGSMEAYFEAKSALFRRCSCAVLNCDDVAVAALADKLTVPTVRIATRQRDAETYAEDVVLCGSEGVLYTLCDGDERLPIRCPVPGSFSVTNSLLAAATAIRLGIRHAVVAEALAGFGGVSGRMERVDTGGELTVLIDYAHTPDALEQLLRNVRGFCPEEGALVLVFGCGGDRDASKRPRMGEIAARLADRIYLTADNSRSEAVGKILSDILDGIPTGSSVCVVPDRRRAIMRAVLEAGAHDVLLLAGKGHERYEIDRTGKHPFDERAVVGEAMIARRKKQRNPSGTL